ncbi:MAG: hypothetical protein IPF54_08410 [Draconibacterium sp.]|nr:hypothetical protein [Draconibacterium sp.]
MIQSDKLNTTAANQMRSDDSAEIKKIIFKILRNWYWFVLSVIIAGGIAIAYMRYTTPVYEVNTSMLFEDKYGSSSPLTGSTGAVGDVFQGLGGLGSMQNIYNQMMILSSTPVVAKTIEELNFEVSYFTVGRVAVKESYKAVPFQVIWDEEHPQLIETDFNLTITPDGKMTLSTEAEKESMVYSYTEEKEIKR